MPKIIVAPCRFRYHLLAVVTTSVVITSCGGNSSSNATTEVASTGPIAQAELAFVGDYTQAQIKDALDRALQLYGLPLTDENYNRAASALVALRKSNGVGEMAVLDHMIRSHVPGVALSFPEAAALSSTFLKAGDK